jgi:hypothetical protein
MPRANKIAAGLRVELSRQLRELKPPTTRPGGPVEYQALACRQADETWLPQTVYYVADRECAWWHVSSFIWADSATASALRICPIVTMLPTRYFVR